MFVLGFVPLSLASGGVVALPTVLCQLSFIFQTKFGIDSLTYQG